MELFFFVDCSCFREIATLEVISGLGVRFSRLGAAAEPAFFFRFLHAVCDFFLHQCVDIFR